MKTKICTINLLLLLSCLFIQAQEFKKRHIEKLENLDIIYKTEYSLNVQATKELHQILQYDFKRKAKNTTGSVLLTVGMGGLIGGAFLIFDGNKNGAVQAPVWSKLSQVWGVWPSVLLAWASQFLCL